MVIKTAHLHWLFSVAVLLFTTTAAAQTKTKTLSWEYDSEGRISELTYPAPADTNQGKVSSFTYKPSGGHDAIVYDGKHVISTTYYQNNHGNPTHFVYSGQWDAGYAVAYFSYDSLLRPIRYRVHIGGSKTYDAQQIQYNAMGAISRLVRSDQLLSGSEGVFAYDYDGHGQLSQWQVGAQTVNYSYDDVGNQLSSGGLDNGTFVKDPLWGQYSSDHIYRHAACTYDDQGRVVEDLDYHYTYDQEGRLKAVIDRITGDYLAHYLYDAEGNRVRTLSEEKVTYHYHRGDQKLVAEETFDQEGDQVERLDFVIHNGKAVAEVRYDASRAAKMTYRFIDHLGSPVVKWRNGTPDQQQYAPFGQQLIGSVAQRNVGGYGFTGHEDDDTGLTYMKARYYDNQSARFLTTDPARDFNPFNAKSYNLYQYVGNDPINIVDPSGMFGTPHQNSGGVSVQALFKNSFIEGLKKLLKPRTPETGVGNLRGALSSGTSDLKFVDVPNTLSVGSIEADAGITGGQINMFFTMKTDATASVPLPLSYSLTDNGQKVPTVSVGGRLTSALKGKASIGMADEVQTMDFFPIAFTYDSYQTLSIPFQTRNLKTGDMTYDLQTLSGMSHVEKVGIHFDYLEAFRRYLIAPMVPTIITWTEETETDLDDP